MSKGDIVEYALAAGFVVVAIGFVLGKATITDVITAAGLLGMKVAPSSFQ